MKHRRKQYKTKKMCIYRKKKKQEKGGFLKRSLIHRCLHWSCDLFFASTSKPNRHKTLKYLRLFKKIVVLEMHKCFRVSKNKIKKEHTRDLSKKFLFLKVSKFFRFFVFKTKGALFFFLKKETSKKLKRQALTFLWFSKPLKLFSLSKTKTKV